MYNRVLFYAFTPFEIISSIAIKVNHYSDYKADIILDDSISMREAIKNNSSNGSVFERVIYCNRSELFHKNKRRLIHELNRFKSTVNPLYIAKKIKGIDKEKYDYFITTEVDYVSESIFCYLLKHNNLINVCLMDEGYSSYTYNFREKYRPKLWRNRIKNLFFYSIGGLYGRKFISREAEYIYLYEPMLQCWNECPYEAKKIIIRENNILDEINGVFGYEKDIGKEYDKKIIFFEESFFADRGNSNDVRIIDYIADKVGKENIIIKLHPRNNINRFIGEGYKTNKGTGIPWELIAINLDESSDKCFITFSSGAVLNYKFIIDKSFKTILLYKCIGDDFYHISDEIKKWFEKFTKLYPDQIFIPETKEELLDYLTELGN